MIFWITGLPGSGKSTLARLIHEKLIAESKTSIHLDGDELRKSFQNQFGYSRSDRIILGNIYINLAILFAKQGLNVVVSTVSMFSEIHERIEIEKTNHEFKVIWIDASIDLLDKRNQKNLRENSVANSPGITLEINCPTNWDLKLTGEEKEEALSEILKVLISC